MLVCQLTFWTDDVSVAAVASLQQGLTRRHAVVELRPCCDVSRCSTARRMLHTTHHVIPLPTVELHNVAS